MANFRQGDVMVLGVPKKKMPTNLHKALLKNGYKPKADNIVIEGELTGHKHEVINGKLYEKEDKIIIEAFNDCVLKHNEHDPIKLARGLYEIKIQEEYDEVKHTSKVKD